MSCRTNKDYYNSDGSLYLCKFEYKISKTANEISKNPRAIKKDRGVLEKRCSGDMQQIYSRTSMPKCDFKATLLKSHFGMGALL